MLALLLPDQRMRRPPRPYRAARDAIANGPTAKFFERARACWHRTERAKRKISLHETTMFEDGDIGRLGFAQRKFDQRIY